MNKSIKTNAILNAIRQCVSILYGIFTIPYVSRILGSEAYGKINFSTSLISYFILIAGLGISTYAVREGARLRNSPTLLQKFVNEVYTINVITSIVSYVLLFLLCFSVTALHRYNDIILVLSVQIIFITVGTDWINTIYEDYLYTTLRITVVHIISFLILILFVKKPEDYLIYALVVASNKVISNVINLFYIRRKYICPKLMWGANLNKHLSPLFVLFFNALTISIYVDSDKTMLSFFISDTATGIYSVAVNIYVVVKTLVNAMVGVALPRLSRCLGENNRREYDSLVFKVFHALLMIVLPCSIGLFFLSDRIIIVLSGVEYLECVFALKILSGSLVFGTIAYCITYAVMIPQKMEKQCFVASVISALSNVLLNLVLIPVLSLNGAAITTLFSEIIVVCISFGYCRELINIKKMFKGTMLLAFASIIVALLCIIIKTYISKVLLSIMVSFGVCAIVYFVLLFALKDCVFHPFIKNILDTYNKKSWLNGRPR